MRMSLSICLAMMAISTGIILAIESSDTDQQYIWDISNPYGQKKLIFNCSGTTKGNISSVEVTPKGRSVSAYLSHIANIDQSKIKLHERTSALPGSYLSEDSIKFESEIVDLADYYFFDPLLELYLQSTVTISSCNATRNIKYAGKKINDRDYTFIDFDQYGKDTNVASFLYNKNFSKDRTFISPGEFSVRAETTGLSQLEFNHNIKDESNVVKDEMYFGKFNISLNSRHEFGPGEIRGYCPTCTEYYPWCEDWMGDICEAPCWDQLLLATGPPERFEREVALNSVA